MNEIKNLGEYNGQCLHSEIIYKSCYDCNYYDNTREYRECQICKCEII